MSLVFIFIINLLFFFAGKFYAQVENSFVFRDQLVVLIKAIKRVDEISAFKGKSIKDLSYEELVNKVQEQLDLMKHG